MNATPGWYHAEGDPTGTARWWDGSQWVGEPQVQTAAAQSAAPVTPAAPPLPPTPGGGFPASPPPLATTTIGDTYPDRSPLEWTKLALVRWKDFDGRSRRSEYWWFGLISNVVLMVAAIPAIALFATETAIGTIVGAVLLMLVMIASLLLIVPTLAVSVRRLHDTNRSGWFLLLNFVPCVSLVLLIFFFMEGTRGPNQYGVDSKP